MSALTGTTPGVGHAQFSAKRGVTRRLLRDPIAVMCLLFIAFVTVVAVIAPMLTDQSPTASSISNALAPASATNPLGTDGVGRDVFAQLVYGARTSLLGALVIVLVSHAIGLPAGLIGGYYRGAFDAIAGWLSGLVMALPGIIVLVVVVTQFGRSTVLAMAVFGVIISPAVYRLVRSLVLNVREELYVDAARATGLRDLRVITRHILPVVIPPVVIQASMLVGIGLVVQAGLDFLGLGDPDQASWGGMLSAAFQKIYTAPALLVWPGAAIVLTITAFALLGNSIRDVLGVSASVPRRAGNGGRLQRTSASAVAAEGAGLLLALDNLTVAYPERGGGMRQVVHGVSLQVRRGEILGLVGESGSGKSQTAFSLLGLLPAQAVARADGLSFDGVDLRGLSDKQLNKLRGKRIGYIPQEPMSNLDPSFRIGYQLTAPIRQHLGLSASEAKMKALALLSRVGIAEPERVFGSYPHEISGGMAQRVLIAGAVSCDPDLIIADEPTTALDVTVQAEVLDLLRELQAERNLGMVLVTHNFGVVADLCNTVAVMQEGRILEYTSAEALFQAPAHAYTRSLLASTLEDAPLREPVSAAARSTDPAQENHS